MKTTINIPVSLMAKVDEFQQAGGYDGRNSALAALLNLAFDSKNNNNNKAAAAPPPPAQGAELQLPPKHFILQVEIAARIAALAKQLNASPVELDAFRKSFTRDFR